MTPGIDYSFSHPTPAQIKAYGAAFVCRYLAPINASTRAKVLTRAEAQALHAADLDVVLVWEWTADRAAAGRAAGVSDARAALAQATALGAEGAVLYFAVDYDASASACRPGGAVYAYAQGWASVLGADRSGVYGGYTAVAALMSAGLCRYGWQTTAWSGGRWYAGAQIRQGAQTSIGGHSVDLDAATTIDYGAWSPDMPLTTADAQLVAKTLAADATFLNAVGHQVWVTAQIPTPAGSTTMHSAQTILGDLGVGVGSAGLLSAVTAKVVAGVAPSIAAAVKGLGPQATAQQIATLVEQNLANAFSAAASGTSS